MPGLALALLLAAAPIVGPELDPDPAPPTITLPYALPLVVASSSRFVVVWEDPRELAPVLRTSRYDPALGILDPGGFPLVEEPAYQPGSRIDPALACTGSSCLATWIRSGGALVFARFDDQALPLGTSPEVLAQPRVSSVAAAAGDGEFLVAYSLGSGGSYELRAARVAADGTLLDPVPLELGTSGSPSPPIAAAFRGGNFLVAWSDGSDVQSLLVPIVGPPGAAAPVAPAGGVSRLLAAAGPGGFLLGLANGVALSLVPLDGRGTPTGPVIAGVAADEPASLTSDGSSYLLAYGNGNDVEALPIGEDGAATGAAVNLGQGHATGAAALPGAFAVAILGSAPSVQLLDAAGALVASHAAELLALPSQWESELEASGSGLLLAYDDEAVDELLLRVRELDSTGAPLGPALAIDTLPGDRLWPRLRLAANPSSALFGWTHPPQDEGFARRIEPGGVLPGASPDLLVPRDAAFAVGTDGADFLVVWPTATGLEAARLTLHGELLDAPPLVLSSAPAVSPAVAFGGGVYLVVWSAGTPAGTILASRVDPAGVLLDLGGLELSDRSGGAWDLPPAISFDGSSFLVAWSATSGPAAGAVGVRIRPDGTVLDAQPFSIVPGGIPHALAFDGLVHLLVYDDWSSYPPHLRAVRLDPEGQLLDATPAELATHVPTFTSADAVALAPGAFAVAYTRWIETPPSATRVRLRTIESAFPAGTPCDHALDCLSASCADGLCCDAPCRGACQACSLAAGAAADGACTLVGAARTCRETTGPCDLEERCDGATRDCPADSLADASAVCRASTAACDAEERCSGTSRACPEDGLAGPETVCRPATGDCDLDDRCSGTAVDCGPDARLPAGELCRDAAGACDLAERCDGSTAACPPDELQDRASVCRAQAGFCDAVELCDGASPDCPPDLLAIDVVCRPSSGPCDPEELCTGRSADCDPDERAPTGGRCDDGDPATTGERCTAEGACERDEPVDDQPEPAADAAGGGCGCGAAPAAAPAWALLATLALGGPRLRRRRPGS